MFVIPNEYILELRRAYNANSRADFRRTKNSSTQSDNIEFTISITKDSFPKMKRIIVLLALIDLVGLSLK
jgi:hypothetical protein